MELNELSSIGCLKRMELCKEDFNKTKDHGEIVAGHGIVKRKEIVIVALFSLLQN